MAKTDKITELIDMYRQELKEHYKQSGKIEADRERGNGKFSYIEGNNDAYINAKESFVEELEKLKEYYSYE